MRRIKCFAPVTVLRLIYFSIVYPHLTYCVPAWGSCSKGLNVKVKTAQNRATKTLPAQNNENTYFKYKLLNFGQIFDYFSCTILYKIINNNYHSYLTNKLSSQQIVHNHYTRFQSMENITPAPHRLSASQQAFSFQAAKSWNNIPTDIRNSDTLSNFKHKLKTYYINTLPQHNP